MAPFLWEEVEFSWGYGSSWAGPYPRSKWNKKEYAEPGSAYSRKFTYEIIYKVLLPSHPTEQYFLRSRKP